MVLYPSRESAAVVCFFVALVFFLMGADYIIRPEPDKAIRILYRLAGGVFAAIADACLWGALKMLGL
jgi:hypothetical protein